PPSPAAAPSVPTAAPVVSEQAERDIRVETPEVIAVFTNRGARLKSWRLKHYFDSHKEPQELIQALPGQPLPFTLRTRDESVNAALSTAVFAATGAPDGTTTSPVELKFAYRDTDGLAVDKQVRIEPGSYIATFSATVTKGSATVPATILWGPAIG